MRTERIPLLDGRGQTGTDDWSAHGRVCCTPDKRIGLDPILVGIGWGATEGLQCQLHDSTIRTIGCVSECACWNARAYHGQPLSTTKCDLLVSITLPGYNSFSRSLSLITLLDVMPCVDDEGGVSTPVNELGGETMVADILDTDASEWWPGMGRPFLLGDGTGLAGFVKASNCLGH